MWGNGGQYGAWAHFLERWATGEPLDPGRLPPLKQEDFAGDSWERLARRLGDAIGARLNLWGEGLNRGIAESRNEFEVGRALTSARAGLRAIRALAGHPGIPVELGTKLLESVDRQVREAQRILESQVEDERRRGATYSVVEERLRTLRDNPLTVVLNEQAAPNSPAAAAPATWAVDPGAAPRRRIVFD